MNSILGKLRVTHDLHLWLVGKPMVNFLFMSTFRYLLWFRSYEAKRVPKATIFTGGIDLFALKFYLDRVVPPSIILGIRELETLGYPKVKTESLCVPWFWHSTRVWRTDRRICRIYSACKVSFAARCKKYDYIFVRTKSHALSFSVLYQNTLKLSYSLILWCWRQIEVGGWNPYLPQWQRQARAYG